MRRNIRCHASHLKPQGFCTSSRGLSGEHNEVESFVLLSVRACILQPGRSNIRIVKYVEDGGVVPPSLRQNYHGLERDAVYGAVS